MSRYPVPLEAGQQCGQEGRSCVDFLDRGRDGVRDLKYRICVLGTVGKKRLNLHGRIIRSIDQSCYLCGLKNS